MTHVWELRQIDLRWSDLNISCWYVSFHLRNLATMLSSPQSLTICTIVWLSLLWWVNPVLDWSERCSNEEIRPEYTARRHYRSKNTFITSNLPSKEANPIPRVVTPQDGHLFPYASVSDQVTIVDRVKHCSYTCICMLKFCTVRCTPNGPDDLHRCWNS